MKKLLLISLISTLVSCGVRYSTTSINPIEDSFQTNGTKEQLYVEAANWMAEMFQDPRSVIKFMDKEAGIITGRYVLNSIYEKGIPTDSNDAIIILQVKDGASKITVKPYTFTEMIIAPRDASIYGKDTSEPTTYTKENAVADIKALILSYQEYVNNQDFEFK